MATQYTPILQLALPVTGELNGTWGDVVNDNITSMVEEAIAGKASISTWTANSHTLTTANGTTDEARCAMLVASTGAGGTALTAAGEIICPARTKLFVLSNTSAYAVTLKTSAGTGVAVAAGETAFLFCDGTDVKSCVTQIVNGHITGNLTVDGNAQVNGNTTLGDAVGDTITVNGTTTFVNANPTLSQGTANRVLFLNASKVVSDAAGLTWDGTTLSATKLAGAFNGTVGATTPTTGVFTQVDITAQGDLRLQDTTGGEYVALQAPGTLASSYTLTLPVDDGTSGQALVTDGSGNLSWSTAASGDVYGPASSTDTAVALFDGTTGKLIKNSGVTIDGSNNVFGVAQLNATTADLTNLEVTNIKAKDGTAAISIADTTGVVTGSTPQVISVNSNSDALRITQTGSGNALVVEDSANPDSSPFVIDASGNVGIGISPAFANTKLSSAGSGADAATWSFRYSADAFGYENLFIKSRGTSLFSPAIVQVGDRLGGLRFSGWDGSAYSSAASIVVDVDGTPGTNDMPGRLVFGTTADGASSPTERMRITSAGNIGVGTTPAAYTSFYVSKAMTGGVNTYGVLSDGQVQSDSTSSATYFWTGVRQAAGFTLSTLNHYSATQGTISGTVTNQYGFSVGSSLTGATNNYGFHSNIASGTGRYNFYAAGTAPNYFAGSLGIGDIGVTGYSLLVSKNITGATTSLGIGNFGAVQSDVTTEARYLGITMSTAAAAFTVPDMRGIAIFQSTIGAGSTVTNQVGCFIGSNLTGATNNYGFYSGIASGTGRYNFYAAGSADNYFAGNVGINETSFTSKFHVTTPSQGGIATFKNTNASWAADVNVSYSPSGTETSAIAFSARSDGSAWITTNYGATVFRTGTGGSASERMRIDSSGRVGIGASPATSTRMLISGVQTGNTSQFGCYNDAEIQSDVTSVGGYFTTSARTAAASFTLGSLHHYSATKGTFGAGSTVTNQYGYIADASLTGATNNYGFYSNIASGTGRYNFYAGGSADNYFAGRLQAQSFRSIGEASDLVSSAANLYTLSGVGGTLSSLLWRFVTGANDVSAGTERMRIDSSGNLIQSAPTTAPTLSTNGTMVFNLTSNTNLRVSVRGSDGVTRTANITLA